MCAHTPAGSQCSARCHQSASRGKSTAACRPPPGAPRSAAPACTAIGCVSTMAASWHLALHCCGCVRSNVCLRGCRPPHTRAHLCGQASSKTCQRPVPSRHRTSCMPSSSTACGRLGSAQSATCTGHQWRVHTKLSSTPALLLLGPALGASAPSCCCSGGLRGCSSKQQRDEAWQRLLSAAQQLHGPMHVQLGAAAGPHLSARRVVEPCSAAATRQGCRQRTRRPAAAHRAAAAAGRIRLLGRDRRAA